MDDFESIKQQIGALYEKCLEEIKPFHTKIDVCVVPEYLAKLVYEATKIDIANYVITIDNFGISHTLLQHGNPITEAKRGQVAIEKEDFIKCIEVILHPDTVFLINNTKRTNLPQIQFEKVIENKKIVVKEIRTVTSTKKKKVNRLVFQTMYKFKKPN
ncbi:PBECR3 domain-containing polyvalent protein [Flavobacterium branchiophilum]|uniref:Phage-Barnase-EndoU-ColicinE5/D-RelE like nuclease 3 domain-containing protein n=1 Tax=Flavobacterium branchiophilum TaxID=55197 RepID=A0A2H3KEK6_9FLAO|nr:hypothetical protein [Flavobacterium branchiophilum]PDS26734.1 hypothetical protein B0A77_01750 [Flavobacterium branchiophilum]